MIEIGLSSPKRFSIIAKLIQLCLGTNYNHVYIRIGDFIYQATGRGVHKLIDASFIRYNDIHKVHHIDLDPDVAKLICEYYLGKNYGYLTILGICSKMVAENLTLKILSPALHLLSRLGKNLGKDGPKSFICSELAAYIIEAYTGETIYEKDYVTPRDIEEKLEWIIKQKNFTK